jgi:N-acetylglucosamine-6-sulfatase
MKKPTPRGNPVSRRTALRALSAAAAAPILAGASPARPNVVFIVSDDHRHDALGFMDKTWLPTPNLDRLFREGVQFKNSFVTTSLCSPSRASFLTGQYARRHGVQNNLTPWRDANVTFLEVLHRAGYRTGFIGKWHMPGKGLPDLVGQGKADRMVSFTAMGGQGVYNDCPLVIDGQATKAKGYITDVLTDYALDFLDKTAGAPFCLHLSHKAVHLDFVPPERHRGRLDGMPIHPMEQPTRHLPMGAVHVPQRMKFTANQQAYYETLLGVDDSVGRVLGWLDDHGAAENTLVIYVGDNGYFWGEHGLIDKRYAYEEGIRVPHLMRFPARVREGGRVAEEMVLNIDAAPTILDACGEAIPAGVQGASVMPLLSGGAAGWRRSFLYEYFADPGFPHPPMLAARTADWKYITYDDPRFPAEFYNLCEDPGERNDLINDPAAAKDLAAMRAELQRLDAETGR